MIIYRMVIVEGRCTKLQLLMSYIYDHWLTQNYSEFWLVRYNAGYCCYFLLPSYIYDHCRHQTPALLCFKCQVELILINSSQSTCRTDYRVPDYNLHNGRGNGNGKHVDTHVVHHVEHLQHHPQHPLPALWT